MANIFGKVSGIIVLCLSLWLMLPEKLEYESFKVVPTKAIPNTAVVNDKLSIGSIISIDPYHGGESIVAFNGSLYTGVREGKILRIDGEQVTVFTDLCWPSCDSSANRGRPLGMRLSPDGTHLLVLDATLGLFSVSFSDGSKKKVFPLDDTINPVVFDDFDVLPNGTIILSEMSSNYYLNQILDAVLVGDSSGRVLSVDPETGTWFEIVRGMRFANGVQLHTDGKSVLIAETLTYRVLRVPLDGGEPTVFADGLPGQPDNIRPSSRGGYWVPVNELTDTWFGKFVFFSADSPRLRMLLYKLYRLSPIRLLAKTHSGMLLRLNEDGQVIEAWTDPKGIVRNAAEVCEYDGELYIGSFFLPFIGRYKM